MTWQAQVEGLKTRAKEVHQHEMREWGLELDNIEQAQDVHLYVSLHLPPASHLQLIPSYSAHNVLFSAVHPLLHFIGSYTGCYVTLLAAAPPPDTEDKPYFAAYVHNFACSEPQANPQVVVFITSLRMSPGGVGLLVVLD